MAYRDMSDEDMIRFAIDCVATGTDIPEPIADFLHKEELYELITQPMVLNDASPTD